jgi:hypothetical protein
VVAAVVRVWIQCAAAAAAVRVCAQRGGGGGAKRVNAVCDGGSVKSVNTVCGGGGGAKSVNTVCGGALNLVTKPCGSSINMELRTIHYTRCGGNFSTNVTFSDSTAGAVPLGLHYKYVF